MADPNYGSYIQITTAGAVIINVVKVIAYWQTCYMILKIKMVVDHRSLGYIINPADPIIKLL
jgi:hypothetical protein